MASTLTNQGTDSKLNISAQTVVKTSPGRLVRIVVNTAGSTAGTANDTTTTGGVAASNLIANIPNTTNAVIYLDFPLSQGLVITPGTSQVLSVSFT